MNTVFLVVLVLIIMNFFLGTYLIYYTFLKWFNKTYIWANKRGIVVRDRPFPWSNNAVVRAFKLKRLYLKVIGNNDYALGIQVRAETHTGADKRLVVLRHFREALFVIQTLEDYFNLPDESRDG
jgi:hypothetical protein